MIGVKQVSFQEMQSWDEYVEKHPHATPYHLMAWGQAVERSYGHKGVYFVAHEGQNIVGVLPLINMSLPLLGARPCSLPFCDLGGVLADTDQAGDSLLEHARGWLDSHGVKQVELRHSQQDVVGELEQGIKVRMLLKLESSAEEQFKQFKSKLRSQVRKAEKNGVVFFEGKTAAHRQEFYRVMQINMHQLGSPVHSRAWFDAVLDSYGTRARLGMVEFQGQVVGGAIILLCGGVVTVPWASTLPEFNHLSPNMLLYWGLLSMAAEGGYAKFDFGRSTVGEGTFKFKKQWGAEPVPLQWQVLTKDALESADAGGAGGGMRDKVAEAWRRMPAPLVNFLGPILRRYISL
ncbi:MAG: FemAB family PEP-CTERM system-associated protein [Ketobacter sp.]|nr:FemAB family PEP-CTERM system-associated protein [Ketobacter sp.]